ncbi:MAG: PEP-CTERM sorting domain-containing protein [Opitutales bacterium]|nr:PEP-CTERM sorting domain-containing protein [Opitutales bacterium]MCH8541920.1 PEP-CTERM sorting domain-containing protein [Opitutales bacterium]
MKSILSTTLALLVCAGFTAQAQTIIINNANGDDNTFNLTSAAAGTVYRADFEDLRGTEGVYGGNQGLSANAYRAGRQQLREWNAGQQNNDRAGLLYNIDGAVDFVTNFEPADNPDVAYGLLNNTTWAGLHLTNTSGSTIAGFEVDFRAVTAQQNSAQEYTFEYAVFTGTGTPTSWNTLSDDAFDFGGTNTTEGSPIIRSAFLPDSSLQNGESLFIRWNNNRAANNDGGMGFNEINLTVIPEPSTYAAIFGLAALGMIVWRRRRLK